MKHIAIIAAVTLILLALVACNRFDESFGPAVDEFFNDYQNAALATIATGDTTLLVNFYADDYLNRGHTRSDAIGDFVGLTGATDILMVKDRTLETADGLRIQWTIHFTIDDAVWSVSVVDLMQMRGDSYIFVGDQAQETLMAYANAFNNNLMALLFGETLDLSDWFTDDYYNEGLGYDETYTWFQALAGDYSPTLSSWDEWTGEVEYTLTGNGPDQTWTTVAQVQDNPAIEMTHVFCGNQQDAVDYSKQKVFVELFTATWCINCPVAEEALYELKQEFGDRLYYIEYHVGDEFYSENINLHNWYATGVAPTAVFQGQTVYIGAPGGVIDYYRDYIQQYTMLDAHAQFTDFTSTLGQPDPTGEVSIELDDTIPTTNLYLKWALVEETATGTNNNDYHQVVTMRGQHALDGVDLSQPVSFEFLGVTEVPSDALVYLWVQTITDEYDSATCKVYNAAEFEIE